MAAEDDADATNVRRQKLAQNQAVFREINERIRELDARFSATGRELELVCECSDTSCTHRMPVPLPEYEQVRAHPARFLIHPGHERREIERVVAVHASYAVVEKLDDAAELVAALDRRTRLTGPQVSV